MEIDHIIPKAAGGLTEESNLCLACRACNDFKKIKIDGIDPATLITIGLFHPKRQLWNEHFSWSKNNHYILGQTPVGRATVEAIHLNRSYLVEARVFWVSAGWHPPED